MADSLDTGVLDCLAVDAGVATNGKSSKRAERVLLAIGSAGLVVDVRNLFDRLGVTRDVFAVVTSVETDSGWSTECRDSILLSS